MAQDWFVTHDRKETGPYSPAQLKQMAATGKLAPTDQVRRSDMQAPRKANTVKGLFSKPSSPSPPSATRKSILVISAVAGGFFLLCCTGLGVIGILVPARDRGKEIAQATPPTTTEPKRPTATEPKPPEIKEPEHKLNPKGVIEWKKDDGGVVYYSDNLIPILYGIPESVLREMPSDQRELFQSIEKLGAEANEAAKEESNASLRQRMMERVDKQSSVLTAGEKPPSNVKHPLKGWVGQLRLGSTEAVISIGTRTVLTPFDPFYDADVAAGKRKPPRTLYCSGGGLSTIIIETKLFSDKAIAQLKGLKDGDWVKFDLPDASISGTALVSFAEKFNSTENKRELWAVYGDLTIRETGAARYSKPRTDEPVIRKLSAVR